MESTSPRFGLVAESIDGSGLRLRRYHDGDVDAVRGACDDPLTRRFLPLLPSPYTTEDAVWWITEGSLAAFESGGGNYAVVDPADDRLLGGIGVTHQREGNGEIGYWMAPWARRRGVATAATRTLTDYAFAAGYGRLVLRTEYENTPSQRVAIAAGYTREGVQRAAATGRDGSRHDLIAWSRVAGDPPGPARRLLPDLPGGALTDGHVTLTPLGAHDAAPAYELHARADVWGSSSVPAEPTRADVTAMCQRAGAAWLAGTTARVAVRDAATGSYVGDASLYRQAAGEGIVGYAVLPAWRGRGVATRTLRLLSRWALSDVGPNLARLVAGTAPDNAASRRVLERAGFTHEGVQRGHLPAAGGGRADVVSYALLASDLADAGQTAQGAASRLSTP